MTRKIAVFVFAVAALTVAGFSLGARGAEAASGPQAFTGGPYSSVVGSAIQFDGTASSGVGLRYFWTFGDGSVAEGARPVKAYAASGVYRVTLTVQDITGAQSVAATTATIGGSRLFLPGGCFSTVSGIVCNSTVGSVFSGCYLTVAGWVCPGTVPGVVLAPGFVTTAPAFTATGCANPAYALTPFCRDMR